MKEYIYFFDEGNAKMKDLLGGKGANLAEMTRIGLSVPPGFIISTEACNEFHSAGKYPEGLEDRINEALKKLEKKSGMKLGNTKNPLLLSVRSGAKFSMPGMMDTILNLGINDHTIAGLISNTGNPRFAYDCYRRFIQMFGNVVLGIGHEKFEEILDRYKKGRMDTDLNASELEVIINDYKAMIKHITKKEFPEDARRQLEMCINAVFNSWNNKRAITYRKIHGIPDNLGTAVNVQLMVFGNTGNDSATGVGFTRNPSTGEKEYYGEYLINAQGEDVVAGIRTPKPVGEMKNDMPHVYKDLTRVYELLEMHYKDMQDFEFTVQRGKLFLLQTRTGKRTIQAAIKIAVDMVNEGLISKEEAIQRIDADQIGNLLHKRIRADAKKTVVAKGLAASPGAASGIVVFDSDRAVEMAEFGKKVILVRPETTPDDIHGMHASQGILTSAGGMTSHAAVVARGMGKPCIVGCGDIRIDFATRQFTANNFVVREGSVITIDGSSGEVIMGEVPTEEPEISNEFKILLGWSDEFRVLGVRTNADLPHDAKKAREFGAEGIGLCRTEHMFFAEDRLPIMQRMIMSETSEERRRELEKLLPMQESDFIEIFKVMDGLPVTIRLIDPPLHEFLPNAEKLIEDITILKMMKLGEEKKKEIADKEAILHKVRTMRELNPMLGFRGCRLGIVYPEIFDMQVRAIIKAAVEAKKQGCIVYPEIMIPLVSHRNELSAIRERSKKIIEDIFEEEGMHIDYKIGTMVELPRACITADEIAEYADFLSFGTNDLTQTVYGFSRDDAEGKFFKEYLEQNILDDDPFIKLDQNGVGKLMKIAVGLARSKKDMRIGICGEHGGDPSSIEFSHKIGLTYVSCSPFRVPVARIAAAQAAIGSKLDATI